MKNKVTKSSLSPAVCKEISKEDLLLVKNHLLELVGYAPPEEGLSKEELHALTISNNLAIKKYNKICKGFRGKYTGPNGLCKWLGKHDKKFFAKYYFPTLFDIPFGVVHDKIFESVNELLNDSNSINRLLLVEPRGHGKSTIGNTLIGTHTLLYGEDEFILEVTSTKQSADRFIQTIRNNLTDNERIVNDFGLLKGEPWSTNVLSLTNGNMLAGYGYTATSIRGININGRRPTFVIIDDMESESTVSSDTETKRLKEVFHDVILGCLDNRKDRLIYLGTILSDDCLINDIRTKSRYLYNKVQSKAIESWATNTGLWEDYFKIRFPETTDTLSVKNRIKDSDKFFAEHEEAMLDGTRVAWDSARPYKYLMDKMYEMGKRAFMKEYQHELTADGDMLFYRLFRYEPLTPEYIATLEKVCYVDISEGTENGDYSSITILGRDKTSGFIYVLYIDAERRRHEAISKSMFELFHNPLYSDLKYVGYEVNGQGFAYKNMKKYFKDNNSTFNTRKIHDIHITGKKEERIKDIEPSVSNGTIRFPKKLDKLCEDMILKFGTHKHDDVPDSLANAVAMFKKIKGGIKVK